MEMSSGLARVFFENLKWFMTVKTSDAAYRVNSPRNGILDEIEKQVY